MTLSEELTWRGFVNQTTFSDIKELDGEKRTFYFGADPSADSMQIGNLAAMMMCRHFIEHGYKPILLVGGATGMIGDPDGKKQERDLRNAETVARNVEGLRRQFVQIFNGKDFEIVDNADWFRDINYIDFLHQIGKHVSMTQLLDREFVQQRIGEGGSGISYGEFSYALIQGYDFLHLYREKGATLQLAGADQWGNSVTGASWSRKLEGGAVWLDPNKTSPYQFYQFWLNCDDLTSEDLIKIYTLLERETVEALIDNHHLNPGERALQKTLAREVTDLVHGRERRESVERVTGVLFGGLSVQKLTDADLDALSTEIPTVSPQNVVSALVEAGVCASNGEARRLIANNAISVNGEKITADRELSGIHLIKKGKHGFVLVR